MNLQNSGECRRENAELCIAITHPRRPGLRAGTHTARTRVYLGRHPEVRAIFGAPRRMVFSAVRAAILRGSQELAPQDDVEIASHALR